MQFLIRFAVLFRQYVDATWKVTVGPSIIRRDGDIHGYLRSISLVGGHLSVVGWSTAPEVEISHGAATYRTKTTNRRDDVSVLLRENSSHRDDIAYGFKADFALEGLPVAVHLRWADHVTSVTLPITETDLRFARLRAVQSFARIVLMGAPKWLTMILSRRRAKVGADVRRALAVPKKRKADRLQVIQRDALLEVSPQSEAAIETATTIIVPVFNSLALAKNALERVAGNSNAPYRVIVVDDKSTDPAVRPWLRSWQTRQGAVERVLIENDNHLGFVGSVNKALKLAVAYGDHVVLLRPNALVPAGWLTRLTAPLRWPGRIASTSPMSNDAGILSVPRIGLPTKLDGSQADIIDLQAARLPPRKAAAPLRGAPGFCIALNIDALRIVPQLNEKFDVGYSGEVDWCQRTSALGWEHLGLGNLFVSHVVEDSIGHGGDATHRRLSPELKYHSTNDPFFTSRFALSLALLATTDKATANGCPIYFGHSMGGGANNWLNAEIKREAQLSGGAIVVRLGGPSRFAMELHMDGTVVAGSFDDFTLVSRLLEPLRHRRIFYSTAVGDSRPHELPAMIATLRRHSDDTITTLFHDFLPLSPSYTLLNSANQFVGVPRNDDPDVAHVWKDRDGTSISLAGWRLAWRTLLEVSDCLVAFSSDSAAHIATAYPDLASRIVVRPHQMDRALLQKLIVEDAPYDGSRVFATLGSINLQKGGRILSTVVERFENERANRPKFVVLGDMDRTLPIPKSLEIHGRYRLDQLPSLIRRYGVTDFLILSICPETFSFTTHEALATGLPVWTLPLGAQQEAASTAANGRLISIDPSRSADGVFDAIKQSL